MIKVKLTWPFNWPIIKQTPNRSGIWENCQFFINEEVEECDFWVVFDGLLREEKTRCPRGNTLLITAEPPNIKTYHPKFVQQFDQVITCHNYTQMKHPNLIHTQQGLNWMVGGRFLKETKSWAEEHTKDYDELSNIKVYKKEKLLSVVASNKKFTEGHELRYNFLKELKSYFGDEVDIYGVGFREIPDKWDVIYPYKYHLAIENSVVKNYWTEKLSDAFLGGAYPIYYGCSNIYEYFPSNSLKVININDISQSIKNIEKLILRQTYKRETDAVMHSKNLILNKHNLMSLINEFCKERHQSNRMMNTVWIKPENMLLNSSFKRKWKIAFKSLSKNIK